ncbi:hypothetical protein DPMN_114267 [Dreissena polymorpha]|uniref:Uncharacterized protein n=1 Tax=Dreissena polymorpha TaxID=45954 RepID=A0A9D4QRE4_DREPO|nr:hypothetical protein DPMN_114267 [Dreissena polymorpha]
MVTTLVPQARRQEGRVVAVHISSVLAGLLRTRANCSVNINTLLLENNTLQFLQLKSTAPLVQKGTK